MQKYMHRKLHPNEDVWVYRNIARRGGVWYSVMQRGLVIGHTQKIDLVSCTFKVRKAGHERVVVTGKKNVHAFVVGRISNTKQPRVGLPGKYNPYTSSSFIVLSKPITKSKAARLDSTGLTVWHPEYGNR